MYGDAKFSASHVMEASYPLSLCLMETPERLENCAPTPEEVLEGGSRLEEARFSKLKLLEKTTCVICYSTVKDGQKSFPGKLLH